MNSGEMICLLVFGQSQRRLLLALLVLAAVLHPFLLSVRTALADTRINILGPEGSGQFGTNVTILPNGNIVVTDPSYSVPGASAVGAVYLYDGATGALITTLTGSSFYDQVGSGGVT